MNPTWATIVIGIVMCGLGIIVNVVTVSKYIGTYKEKVDKLEQILDTYSAKTTEHLEKLQGDVVRIDKAFAAFTGMVNGRKYREEE